MIKTEDKNYLEKKQTEVAGKFKLLKTMYTISHQCCHRNVEKIVSLSELSLVPMLVDVVNLRKMPFV